MSIDTQPVARRRHTLFCELTQREEREIGSGLKTYRAPVPDGLH
jgi:hypothetical protein